MYKFIFEIILLHNIFFMYKLQNDTNKHESVTPNYYFSNYLVVHVSHLEQWNFANTKWLGTHRVQAPQLSCHANITITNCSKLAMTGNHCASWVEIIKPSWCLFGRVKAIKRNDSLYANNNRLAWSTYSCHNKPHLDFTFSCGFFFSYHWMNFCHSVNWS